MGYALKTPYDDYEERLEAAEKARSREVLERAEKTLAELVNDKKFDFYLFTIHWIDCPATTLAELIKLVVHDPAEAGIQLAREVGNMARRKAEYEAGSVEDYLITPEDEAAYWADR